MDAHTSTILTFILWISMGAACSYFANQRGRDPYAWFAIGIFLGIFGLLLLILLPPLEQSKATSSTPTPSLLEILDPEKQAETPVPVASHEYLIHNWFCIDKSGQQQNSLSFNALQALWKEGKIDAHSYVWSEGMAAWKKIEEIPPLYQALKT